MTAPAKRPRSRLGPQHPYWISVLGLVLGVVLFQFVFCVSTDTYKQLRGSLFTGFFTAASFLLSAKTLVILNMKKEVYEKSTYLKKIHDHSWSQVEREKKAARTPRADCGPIPQVYKPLSQIGTLLSVNIGLALVTSFSQITVGMLEEHWAVVYCLAMAIATAFLLACSVFLIWQNFQAIYADWESVAQESLDKMWGSASDEFHANEVSATPDSLPEVPTIGLTKKLPGG